MKSRMENRREIKRKENHPFISFSCRLCHILTYFTNSHHSLLTQSHLLAQCSNLFFLRQSFMESIHLFCDQPTHLPTYTLLTSYHSPFQYVQTNGEDFHQSFHQLLSLLHFLFLLLFCDFLSFQSPDSSPML